MEKKIKKTEPDARHTEVIIKHGYEYTIIESDRESNSAYPCAIFGKVGYVLKSVKKANTEKI